MNESANGYRRLGPRDPLGFLDYDLRAGERPPMARLEFFTAEVDVLPDSTDGRPVIDMNRQQHDRV